MNRSVRSQGSRASDRGVMTPSAGPLSGQGRAFEASAATASFFLYAQRNVVLCLHHDTLVVERKFEKHREDVLLLTTDNVSERGAGRLVVSYDAGQTAIVWDLFTGDEVARFAAFEHISVATWMRNGRIAFGNTQGNITLFDPETSEHVSARTIYDPVTALSPAVDCRTFAIGYNNGSILIATVQPFTILHTLTTSRSPSPITGLAWHGSSSKQKTEMLATQTRDGDLRVWSISKPPNSEAPRIIRILGAGEINDSSKSWFAWSKNGRLIQAVDNETRSWDVRTKRVTYEIVPTVPGIVAITSYGPTATLFTISEHNMIQQYDLNPSGSPIMVANKQNAPINAPPTPPDSIPRETPPPIEPPTVPESGSEDEGAPLSPLQKIAQEMDALEDERRDRVGPLSPVSSRASSRNSFSSAGSHRRRAYNKSRDRQYQSSRASDDESDVTQFSGTSSLRSGRESVSIKSFSTQSSSKHRQASSLRRETPRSPEDPAKAHTINLFPFLSAHLTEVKFRTPQLSDKELTPDVLRREMLSVVFGWEDDIESLIREEQSQHPKGSPSSVLLAKWLGDTAADQLVNLAGSASMSSSDWMLLALSCQMGQGSQQRQIGEMFVQRLLEQNEIHPAVAILLGLGQQNDAIEAYVSRKFYMEAVLLTCLLYPSDWQRQSYLVRKWGEVAVANNQAEFAVRCFSCTGIESSEPWFSPRAQKEVNAAQKSLNDPSSPPQSPPSAGARLTTKNAALKLITNFDPPTAAQKSRNLGATPIADSAITPAGRENGNPTWKRSGSRGLRDPSSARTATPGGYGRKREPSVGLSSRDDAEMTPMVDEGIGDSRPGSRMSGREPGTAIKSHRLRTESLPSPAAGAFTSSRRSSRAREGSKDRNRHHLQLQVLDVAHEDGPSRPLDTGSTTSRHRKSQSSQLREESSPLLTDGSMRSYKGRMIDSYISSLEAANEEAERIRAQNRSRAESRDGRSRSRPRQRDQSDPSHIKSAKRSPTSPVPMTTEDANQFPNVKPFNTDGEGLETKSPIDSKLGGVKAGSHRNQSRTRDSSRSRRNTSPTASSGFRPGDRSPPSPSPMEVYDPSKGPADSARVRARSSSRKRADGRSQHATSPDRSTRARSESRKPKPPSTTDFPDDEFADKHISAHMPARLRELSRKELAQKELEERRLSLARRPSAPPNIPHPGELLARPPSAGTTLSPVSFADPIRERSKTADPEQMRRGPKLTSSSIQIGLPATPRAMKHPQYMNVSDERDAVPAVPSLPPQLLDSAASQHSTEKLQSTGSGGLLLPSSVYGQQKAPISRSASAPPEQMSGKSNTERSNRRPSFKHSRRPSEKDSIPLIEPVPEEQVIVVGEQQPMVPAVLPELQHLADPLPPPPPPPPPAAPGVSSGSYFPHYHPKDLSSASMNSGVINITMDGQGNSQSGTPAAEIPPPLVPPQLQPVTNPQALTQHPGPSASPNVQRRGRLSVASAGSGSGGATADANKDANSLSSKWKNVRERMRSESRSRRELKSPSSDLAVAPSPYETVVPNLQWRVTSPQSPSEKLTELPSMPQLPYMTAGMGNASPPRGQGGYRNPKEVGKQYVEGGMF